MQTMQRVSGDRSHLSPVFGKYAPEAARVTETTDLITEIDAVLADGPRAQKRTEKVYGLWERAGDRHAEKGDAVLAGTEQMDWQKARIEAGNRFVGFLAGMATVGAVAAISWALFF